MKTMKLLLMFAMLVPAGPYALAQESDASTSVEDRTDVAVTIYNNNLALVRDRRALDLPTGEFLLRFGDVAEQIKPETVSLRSIAQEGSLAVLEQNYEYDLISPQKLMEKYVGKTVKLRDFSEDVDMPLYVDAELLSVNQGPIYKVDDEIYLGHPGQVVLPKIPENLIAEPSLIWVLNNSRAQQEIEATYLTNGLNWKADYVLSVNEDSTEMDVAGWVTLNNQSGAAYEEAKLKLVAGDVNIARPEMKDFAMMEAQAMRAQAAPQMQQESFAEYHLYTLPRRTTIKQNQSKQVSLLTAEGVEIEKVYEYRGNTSYYSQQIGRIENEKVDVMVTFQNSEENSMGMPLPAGIMRMYQADSDGMMQFAGEDRIDHTPKDEEVRLTMGQAFDIVAERVQTDFTKLGSTVYEAAFEITIRNHKEEDVTVDVVEPMPGDWDVLSNSHEFEKKDAFTAIFPVEVEADGESVLEYRVRVQY